MKSLHMIVSLCMIVMCLKGLSPETMANSQALPPDVGLITMLSGDVTYRGEGSQKPIRARSFMKIRRGDRFMVPAGAVIQFVYFLGGRQETWGGPVTFTVGDSESYGSEGKGLQAQPKVVVFPAGAAQGIRRIPILLHRAGLSRPGSAQIRGDVEGPSPPLSLTPEEAREIVSARETYRALRQRAGPDDITPELYLLGVLTDYEQYGDMEEVINEALKKQPGDETLQELREWVYGRAFQ